MNMKLPILLAALFFCFTALGSRGEAKDLIFNLGYEMIQVIDTDTDQITDIPLRGAVRDTVFSADKKFLYVTGSRRWIHKIDVEKKQLVKTFQVESKGWDRLMYGLALSADGKTGYVHTFSRRTANGEAQMGSPQVSQIDLSNGKILRSVDVPWGVASLALVKGEKTLYAIGQDLYTLDVSQKEMKVVATEPMFEQGINILALWHNTEENGGVWLSPFYNAEGLGLLSIDTQTGKIDKTMIQGDPVFAYSATYSPDKTKAYAIMDELNVIDLKTKTVSASIPIHEGTCYGVMPTSDGKKIYAGGGGSTITVYDAVTLKPLKVLQMETDAMGLRKLTL